ncbi:hypothetical protein CBL_08343 [Carabus blaptoides fortunei]
MTINILEKIRDAHYFQLSSQGNVYTLTNLKLANGTNKILAATLKREVYCFEYPENLTDLLIPTTKEVLFTYIPGVAEIISIDAFNKSDTENDFVIGITITKGGNEQSRENYLNIYSAWEASQDFNLESISQNCLNVELSFIPYHLYHTKLLTWDEQGSIKTEIVWMLSGSDEKVHIYREYRVNHSYKEIDLKECFPEFLNPPSIVMWMDIQYCANNTKRISTYGCECGYVYMAVVDLKSVEILQTYSTRYENTITCVQIFSNDVNINNSLCRAIQTTTVDNYQLLVTNTILPSVVFLNILENGFSEVQVLEGSNYFNVTTCACIADIDLDGENEILIGSYGKEMLAYKYLKPDGWQLEGIKSFANPLYAMSYVDVTGDGLRELIVLTLRGVHVIQHEPDDVLEKLESKLKLLNT